MSNKDEMLLFNGIGSSSATDLLPPRAVNEKVKKSKAFREELLDGLESVGLKQFNENLKYVDYFKMVSGELIYADILDGDDILSDINTVREELELSTNLLHYDIIGDATNVILGEWLLQKDKFRFDTVDEVSTNEYIREQTSKLQEFARLKFESELNRKYAEMGIDPDKQFEDEQQQQQYIQQLEEEANKLIPENIRNKMRNWKTLAANWAKKTYDRDHQRFKMDLLEAEEALSKLLVGVAPRHYLIGWDYYEPESWSAINTFYSKDVNLRFIQDGEYAGRVHFMPPHEIIERYGHRLDAKTILRITEAFSGKYIAKNTNRGHGYSIEEAAEKNFVEPTMVPFKGADEYAIQLQFQDFLQTPLGEYEDKDGNVSNRWLPNIGNSTIANSRYAYYLQTNKNVRTDLLQVTECYVKCYKEVGVLTYRTETGYLDTVEVDEDLLKEFLSENNIKRVRTVTLKEAYENPVENTIVYTYFPEVYQGLKINTSNTLAGDSIYILEPCEVQIKSNSNYYKLQLPVFGHIDNGIAELMRPLQIDYNWVMNQNKNLMGKELGMFFMFDVNFLPSEFMDLTGDSKDILVEMYNTIKEIGILPIDASKGNLGEKGGVQFNSMMPQNVTFTPQIQRNVELARLYKQEAFSRIGINLQREAAAISYETATGARMAQNASYSKTINIFQNLLYDKQCKIEGHIAVAQHCQINGKDANHIYRAGDDELIFLETIKKDKDFSLRQFGIYSVMDASKRMEFERLKEVILQRNTMTADELSLAEIIYSDDYLQLKEAAQKLREYQERQKENELQTLQQIEDKKEEAENKRHSENLELEYAKLENKLEVERIESLGRAGSNKNNQDPTGEINRAADIAVRQQEIEGKQSIEYEKLRGEFNNQVNEFNLKLEEIKLKKEQLKQREKERRTKEYTSIINKD